MIILQVWLSVKLPSQKKKLRPSLNLLDSLLHEIAAKYEPNKDCQIFYVLKQSCVLDKAGRFTSPTEPDHCFAHILTFFCDHKLAQQHA